MRVVRTGLIFASGVAVYALMAACGGGNETASTSPSGEGGGPTTTTGSSHPNGSGGNAGGGGHSSNSANGGNGGAAGGSGGASGGAGPGAGGATTSTAASSGSTGGGSASSSTGSGGGGGGMPGIRLVPEVNLGADTTRDGTFAFVPFYIPFANSFNFGYKPERYFFDTQRQEECVYTAAADGKTRCLPTDVASTPVVYADVACTQRAVGVTAPPPGCQIIVPKYATIVDYPQSQTCTLVGWYPTHVYPTGAFLGPNHACYSKNGAMCVNTGCNAGQSYALYAVGNEVPATKFVAGTLTHD